jgi:hypothetical protein
MIHQAEILDTSYMVIELNELPVSWLITIYNTPMNMAREEIIIYNWSREKQEFIKTEQLYCMGLISYITQAISRIKKRLICGPIKQLQS